jgi:hypothetical protein
MSDHRQAKGRDDIFSAYILEVCHVPQIGLFVGEHCYHIRASALGPSVAQL